MTFRYTRQPLHLATARRCADYFIDHITTQGDPADSIPLWDFSFPGSQTLNYRDASAGAIAASAFVELASFIDVGAAASRYRDAAARILASLNEQYVGSFDVTQGILLHSAGANPQWSPSNFNVSLVYAGYYALEAIARIAKVKESSTFARGGELGNR